jgi:hypothetical protein
MIPLSPPLRLGVPPKYRLDGSHDGAPSELALVPAATFSERSAASYRVGAQDGVFC